MLADGLETGFTIRGDLFDFEFLLLTDDKLELLEELINSLLFSVQKKTVSPLFTFIDKDIYKMGFFQITCIMLSYLRMLNQEIVDSSL